MAPDVIGPLERLRDDLRTVRLELDVPGADEASACATISVAQVDDYLLPRLRQLDAPALIVVGGSTGAGKSTPVSSLVGSVVSPAGVLRPTTRSPVLVCHPDDLRGVRGRPRPPNLARATGEPGAAGKLQLVATEAPPAGLALLDFDIDSVLAGEPCARQPAAGRGGRLALRHDRCPLCRRRSLGVLLLRPGARGPRSRSANCASRRERRGSGSSPPDARD